MVMNAEELRVSGTGDWIVDLRKILQLGPGDKRGNDPTPDQKHRSTKDGVKLLLSNLQTGSGKLRDQDTSQEDMKKVVFNAVELLVNTKVNKTDRNKTWQDALDKFELVLAQEYDPQKLDQEWKDMIDEAIGALKFDRRKQAYDQETMGNDERKQFRKDMLTTEAGLKSLSYDPAYASDLIKSISKFGKDVWDDPQIVANKNFIATMQTIMKSDLATPEVKKIITDRMLKTDDGKQSLAANPIFGGLVLSEYEKTNPGELEEFDFDAMFGADKKSAVVGEALLNIANNNSKTPQNFTGNLFQTLHKQVDPDTWNDKGPLKRGLGPRICQSLWGSGSFKELCALVEHGVDTSLAARVDGEKGVGIYSGFVQPIQHVTSGMLRDIDLLNRVNAERKPIYEKLRKAVAIRLPELEPDHEDLAGDWQNQLRAADNLAVAGDYDAALPLLQTLANALQQAGAQSDGEEKLKHAAFELALSEIPQPKLKHNLIPFTKSRVKGAKMLYEALDKKGGSVTVTSWDEIKDSEMIAAFQENPGTIWGFEYLRMPYVQAAHETDEGAQPIRMMELWDAVEKTFPPDIYEKLLAKPDQTADEILQTLTLTKTPKEFSGKKEQDFEEAFKRDAKKFLLELAKQMPKGLFTSDYKDVTGNTPTITTQTSKGPETTNARMSDVMGVDQNKYMSSFACKVGLWWAKEEKKPLYYCLDGINMDDAINYKIVKNAAIAEFVNGGGLSEDAKSFGDVVTFKEIREILKNWDDLKGTVIFTLKGKVFTPEQAEQKVTEWKQKMELANQQAGRPKAPPKATFTKALNDLDKKLLERIPNTEDGDKDARDIVKKSAYLRKVANTRPSILLKYIESKCTVLAKPEYGLLSPDLSRTAVAYSKAADNEVDAKKKLMLNAIKGCHASFRVPLRNALLNARPVPVQNQAI